MIKTYSGEEVTENRIETLFIDYCQYNNLSEQLKNRDLNDNDAYCIWHYIYNNLFKPDRDTVRVNNKTSKLDYSDIYTLHDILDIYIELCFRYKILPIIEDFCTLTGISRDTLYSWEKGEYREAEPEASFKHSDIIKKIREASKRMGLKDLHDNAIGQQSLANNWEDMGLNFTQKGIQAQADAWSKPMLTQEEVHRIAQEAAKHSTAELIGRLPDE